jgi:hypothetical protein
MMYPLNKTIALIRHDNDCELINDHAWEKIIALIDKLPNHWTFGCLECRLSRRRTRIDLLLGVGAEQGRQSVRQSWNLDENQSPAGSSAKALIQQWSQVDSVLADSPVIWFKWDLPTEDEAFTTTVDPLVAICVDPSICSLVHKPLDQATLFELINRSLPLLPTHGETGFLVPQIDGCLNAIDEKVSLIHIMPLHAFNANLTPPMSSYLFGGSTF